MWGKDTLIIALLTFCTVVLWIFFDAYHTYRTSTIPTELKETISEFDPTLDTKVVEELKKRPLSFEVPTIMPTPETTESEEKEEEKEATEGAKTTITPTAIPTLSPTPTL